MIEDKEGLQRKYAEFLRPELAAKLGALHTMAIDQTGDELKVLNAHMAIIEEILAERVADEAKPKPYAGGPCDTGAWPAITEAELEEGERFDSPEGYDLRFFNP